MIFRKHITPTFGARRLSSIRTSEVQAWVRGLELAPSTVTVVYGKLSAVFRSAVEDRLIPSSPCTRSVKLPRATGDQVVPMAPEQVASMIDTVSGRYGGDARATGRHRATFGPCKTESGVRTIPVPDIVLAELGRHFEQYGTRVDGLLFTDSKGDPIRRNALGHLWRRAVTKAGVVGFSPHDLRHDAASVMIEAGCSVKVVQHHLGHAKASTTLDTYAHLWPDSEETTRKVLDAGLERIASGAHFGAAVALEV